MKEKGFLDGKGARAAAFLVFLGCGAVLAWLHRDDIFPPPPETRAADDPVALCLAERTPGIDQMRRDGIIDEAKAALFKSRAEALCEAQVGQNNGPPTPP